MDKFTVPAWGCTVCREVYLTEDEAEECCAKTEETEVYKCPVCGEVYLLAAPQGFEDHLRDCEAMQS